MSSLCCHLHVGMPKTGTSSIQETLSQIEPTPVRYLPFKHNNHSGYFTTLFEDSPWNHRSNVLAGRNRQQVLQRKAHFENQLARMLQQAALSTATTGVFFSGERLGMPGKVDAAAMERLRTFFAPWCDAFRVYGYVRPLASLLPSDFQQRLQMGAEPSIDLDYFYPRYRERFQKFDTVFDQTNVSLRKFARAEFVGGDVVRDIARQVGIPLGASPIRPANESLSRDAVALYFAMRRAGHLAGKSRQVQMQSRAIVDALRGIGNGKLVFDQTLTQPLFERYAADIAWIEQRISASVSDPPAANDRPIRDDRDLLEIAAEARHWLDQLPDLADADADAVASKKLRAWVDQGLQSAPAIRAPARQAADAGAEPVPAAKTPSPS